MLTRTTVILFIAFITASAQPRLSLAPLDASLAGITIVGPNDPTYPNAVASLIPTSDLPAYTPILPYSIVLQNNTGRPLLGFCVVFEIVNNAGHSGLMLHRFENMPPAGKTILDADKSMFISIERGYTNAALHSRLSFGMSHPQAFYDNAKSITFSLDSALLPDGTIIGPDRQGTFNYYTALLTADRDISAAVLGYRSHPADLTTYLDATAAQDHSTAPDSPGDYHYHYIHELSSIARRLRQQLAKRGVDSVFSNAAGVSTDAASINVHR